MRGPRLRHLEIPKKVVRTVCVMNTIDLAAVALICGVLAWSLARYAPKAVPVSSLAAQGVLGVATGLLVREISCSSLGGSDWVAVIAVAVGTLVVCIAGGALLGMHRGISPLTGALSLVAGGSSGVVSIARELGGDDRVVAAVQYLRVALITAAMPLVVAVVYGGTAADASHDRRSRLPALVLQPAADHGDRRRRRGGRPRRAASRRRRCWARWRSRSPWNSAVCWRASTFP